MVRLAAVLVSLSAALSFGTASASEALSTVDQFVKSGSEISIQRRAGGPRGGHHGGYRGHHPGRGGNWHPPRGGGYYPRPAYPVYPHPGYPVFPIYPTPGYTPVYGYIVCTAHNNFGYYWQGVGYNQWEASQNALAYCYQYSGYCQVTACGYR